MNRNLNSEGLELMDINKFKKLIQSDKIEQIDIDIFGYWRYCAHNDSKFLEREILDILIQKGLDINAVDGDGRTI